MSSQLPDITVQLPALRRRREDEKSLPKTRFQHEISVVRHRLAADCVQPEDWQWRLPKMTVPAKPDYSAVKASNIHLPRLLTQPRKRESLNNVKILPRIQDSVDKKKALQGIGRFLRQMATLAPVNAISEFGERFDGLLATTTYLTLVAPPPPVCLSPSWRLCRAAEELEKTLMHNRGSMEILSYPTKQHVPIRKGGGFLFKTQQLSIKRLSTNRRRGISSVSAFLFGKRRTIVRKRIHSRRIVVPAPNGRVGGYKKRLSKVSGIPAVLHLRHQYLDRRRAIGEKRKTASTFSNSKHRCYDLHIDEPTSARQSAKAANEFLNLLKNGAAWQERTTSETRSSSNEGISSGVSEDLDVADSRRRVDADGGDMSLEDLEQTSTGYNTLNEDQGMTTHSEEIVLHDDIDGSSMLLHGHMMGDERTHSASKTYRADQNAGTAETSRKIQADTLSQHHFTKGGDGDSMPSKFGTRKVTLVNDNINSNRRERSHKASVLLDVTVTTAGSPDVVNTRRPTSYSTGNAQLSQSPQIGLFPTPIDSAMLRRHSAVPSVMSPQPDPSQTENRDDIETISWLSKYCIIRKDRLQLYRSVFQNVISQQPHLYEPSTATSTEVSLSSRGGEIEEAEAEEKEEEEGEEQDDEAAEDREEKESISGSIAAQIESYEDRIVREWLEKSRAYDPEYNMVGLTVYQQAVVAIDCYITERQNRLRELEKELRTAEARLPPVAIMQQREEAKKKKRAKVTPMTRIEYTVERLRAKVDEANRRIKQLHDDRIIVDKRSRDDFINVPTLSEDAMSIWRTRSNMYRDLHPIRDDAMNMEELEGALQTINSHLITDDQMHYIYRILDLHPRRRVGIKLFSVIAALSEKVAKLDVFTKKLINTFDFESLEEKLRLSKDLFNLMKGDEYDTPAGAASSYSVLMELYAGGMTPIMARKVLRKLERDGCVDFLDYLMYVPLFVEVHNHIIDNPINVAEL